MHQTLFSAVVQSALSDLGTLKLNGTQCWVFTPTDDNRTIVLSNYPGIRITSDGAGEITLNYKWISGPNGAARLRSVVLSLVS